MLGREAIKLRTDGDPYLLVRLGQMLRGDLGHGHGLLRLLNSQVAVD